MRVLLSVIYNFNKYSWVVPLKNKKGNTITNVFHKCFDGECKPNKISLEKDPEFYDKSIKSWFENNNIKIYSKHNKGKLVVDGKFIRTLKNKI